MRAAVVASFGLLLVAARAQAAGPDAGDAQAAGPDPAAALLAECSQGEENDRCSLLEAAVTSNLLDDLETLYWAIDQRSVPVALQALKIDDPRIQLAALRILEQFADADGVADAVQPLLFGSTMVLPSAAAVVLDIGPGGLPGYLGGLYRKGHGDEAWTDEDNLFTTAPVPDAVSAGFTVVAGLTPYPPADYFDKNFTSAGFTTTAPASTVVASYAASLGATAVDFLSWALSFYTTCPDDSAAGRCLFLPLLGQFSAALDENKPLGVIESAGAGPAKLVMIHADPGIGKTIVRLAWLTPTALPQKIPTLPDGQVGSSLYDGGVASGQSPDAPQFGSLVDAGQVPNGPPVTVAPAKKSSGCQLTASSGGALPIFACLGLAFWLATRRTRKSG
jgi:hypothetical protein